MLSAMKYDGNTIVNVKGTQIYQKIIKIWMFSSHNDKIILQLNNLVCL